MNRTGTILTLKYIVYALMLLLLYVLQTVPGLFQLFGAKPVWLVSAAITIAMLEGEFVGGIYGAFAGLLCDMGAFTLFGFNGFFLCVFCVCAGLLVLNLMHCNVWGCLLYVLVTMLVMRGVEFLFSFGIWNYEGLWKIFVFQVLPGVAYTTLTAPISFLLMRGVHRKFEQYLRD